MTSCGGVRARVAPTTRRRPFPEVPPTGSASGELIVDQGEKGDKGGRSPPKRGKAPDCSAIHSGRIGTANRLPRQNEDSSGAPPPATVNRGLRRIAMDAIPTTDFQTSFRVVHGRGGGARILSWFMRLPPAGEAVPLRLRILHRGDREEWTRDFGGRRIRTAILRSTTPGEWRERFGPLEFAFRVVLRTDGVDHQQVRCRFRCAGLSVPLPDWMAPRVHGREIRDSDGIPRVDVQIRAPLIGLLVAYAGVVPEGEHLWSSS